MKKQLYILSGLGADERVFQELNFGNHPKTFISWIEPKSKESIEEYAHRLAENITEPEPILLGLSFGGIMALEIGKLIKTNRIILISSIKYPNELPFYYKIAGTLQLHKFIPLYFLQNPGFIVNWMFGLTTDKEKTLLRKIMKETSPMFMRWALDKVVHWKNKKQLSNVYHIHGKSDRILPLSLVQCDKIIDGGGHMMVLQKSKELNAILKYAVLSDALKKQ